MKLAVGLLIALLLVSVVPTAAFAQYPPSPPPRPTVRPSPPTNPPRRPPNRPPSERPGPPANPPGGGGIGANDDERGNGSGPAGGVAGAGTVRTDDDPTLAATGAAAAGLALLAGASWLIGGQLLRFTGRRRRR